MPDDPAPTPDPTPAAAQAPPLPLEPAAPPSTGLSKADLDKFVAAETSKAKREALKALSDDLGMSIDDVKALVTDSNAAREAQLSEVEKREKAAAKREEAATVRLAEADAQARALMVKEALIDASVKSERRDHAAALIHLEADAGPEEITAAITALAAEVPEFFGSGETASPRLPASVPTGGRPGPATSGDPYANGEAEAERFLARDH